MLTAFNFTKKNGTATKRELQALAGVDLSKFPKNGKAYWTWTGRTYLVMLDHKLMAFGPGCVDWHRIDDVCFILNGLEGPWFIDYGFQVPRRRMEYQDANALFMEVVEQFDQAEVIEDLEEATRLVKNSVDVEF